MTECDAGVIDGQTATDSPARKKEKKRLTVAGAEFVYLYLSGIIFAFVGWLAENIVRLITRGIIDCRFHLLPFISPYALIPFAFQLLLGDPDSLAFFGHKIFKKENAGTKILSNVICAALICAFVFAGELAIGNAWQYISGVSLWDYGNLPFHVTKYAGLIPSLGYGLGAFFVFRFIHKPALSLMRRKVNFTVAKVICATLGVLIVLDTAVMCLHTAILQSPPVYWSVKVR